MQKLRNDRITILASTAALIAVGIIMIYSTSAVYAYEKFRDNLFFLKRHTIALGIGVIVSLAIMSIDLQKLRQHSRKLLLVAFALLIIVLIPSASVSIGGARRWIAVGGIRFQPVEFVKPLLLFYIADFLDRRVLKSTSLKRTFVPLLLVICITSGLILLQPDLGSAIELAIVGFLLLFVYGTPLKHLLYAFCLSVPILYMLILKAPYRLSRIMTFLDPWKDPRGTGFQMIQSFIALGSGGLFGVGLGNSKQKLFYLPESHTDFIFSIIGEELGFIGTSAIVAIFAVLIWKGISIAIKKDSEFSRLLAFGISSLIGLEVIINIGVATGLLPTKGLPLPFLGYGGSSLVAHMVLIAMLLNTGREHVR